MNGAAVRSAAAAQGALGAVLAARPGLLMPLVCGSGDRPAAWIVRVLGVRMALQSLVTAVRPTSRIVLAGGATDLLHGASMVALGRAVPRFRRPALASAGTAFAFATAAALAAGRNR